MIDLTNFTFRNAFSSLIWHVFPTNIYHLRFDNVTQLFNDRGSFRGCAWGYFRGLGGGAFTNVCVAWPFVTTQSNVGAPQGASCVYVLLRARARARAYIELARTVMT